MGYNGETCRRHEAMSRFLRYRKAAFNASSTLKMFKNHGLDEVTTVATETDIEVRKLEQFSLYIRRRSAQRLTPEWRKFGEKHADEIARLRFPKTD